MQNTFTQLGRACRINATMIGFALHAHHVAAAFRTPLRHMEYLVAARMLFVRDDFHDLGNHVATAFDHYPVADLYFQPIDLILIVESGPRYRGPADGNGFERGHRRQLAGTTYLNKNVFNLSEAAARGILVRNGPSWGFARESKPLLRSRGIYFDDYAINFIRQLVAKLLALGNKLQHLADIARQPMICIHFESQSLKRFQRVVMVLWVELAIDQQKVRIEIQPSLRHDVWLKHADGSGGGIARVGKLAQLLPLAVLIHALKSQQRHNDFTTNFKVSRNSGLF